MLYVITMLCTDCHQASQPKLLIFCKIKMEQEITLLEVYLGLSSINAQCWRCIKDFLLSMPREV